LRPTSLSRDLRKRIVLRLREATAELKAIGYKSRRISPKEFHNYMTGGTPTGDTITILDVLDNKFLMIHEVVEISELKKLGIPINEDTVMRGYPSPICETHYTATVREFDYALRKRNYDWLKVRMKHAKSWLEDPDTPQHLVPKLEALIKKFSWVLKSSI